MIRYRILPEQRLIIFCNWGLTPASEIREVSRTLRNDPAFSLEYDVLVDNSRLESSYSREELWGFAMSRVDVSMATGRIAVIAPGDLSYGMSRMHEMLSEMENTSPPNVFRDTDSALKWLGREGVDVGPVLQEIRDSATQALETRG